MSATETDDKQERINAALAVLEAQFGKLPESIRTPTPAEHAKKKQRAPRHKPRWNDVVKPCACCDLPMTEGHHMLPFAIDKWFGACREELVRLCPLCHELFHRMTDRRGRLVKVDREVMRLGDYIVREVEKHEPVRVAKVRALVKEWEADPRYQSWKLADKFGKLPKNQTKEIESPHKSYIDRDPL